MEIDDGVSLPIAKADLPLVKAAILCRRSGRSSIWPAKL